MKGKEKLKRIFSGLIGLTVVANTLLIMPLSTFATSSDEQTFVFDGYTIDYTVTDVYNNTEVVSLTMTNTGEDVIEDWMLYFNPHGEIQYVTDGELKSTSNGTKYIKNSGYNANIAPNESVSFSYAVNDCEEVPSNYIFCQKRVVKETGFDIDFQVNYDWDDSFNGDIIIQNNTDTPIEAWELTFDTNFTITEFTNSWAADVTELGSYCYMMKGTYTGIIGAYTSVPLGFMGKMNGEPEITDCVLTEIVVDEDAINGLNSDTDIDMTDTDSDGLPDFVERELGTNPEVADTDGDGLPDGFELLVVSSDPLNPHTFDSVLTDGEYDNDGDGLSNLEEFLLGTDVNNKDTDRDGLEDGAEVNQYGTDPLNPDTDGDGISDGDEIALNKGLDPRLPDSDGNGIPDGEEKFQQDLTYYEDEANVAISEVTVAFEGTGYIRSTTQIKPADNNVFVNSLAGLMGKPFSFETTSDFWGADISFKVECDVLGEDIDKLGIVWFDEQFQQFRLLDSRYDAENCIISAYVPHFSIYCVVNREEWVTRKGTVYFEAASDLSDTDNDMMPDCYEATNRENPENTFILSNGDETFSLVGEKDTDNDTIIDGAEVVFCTVGDANCDGTVDDKDVVLVQQYLQGKAELSKIGYVNADCNLDGKIDEDDITNIQNYLENGVQVFDFSEDRLQDIVVYMSSQSIGDVDGNGLGVEIS